MAAMIPDARSVRMESGRLRAETHALRLTVRQSAAHSREQLRAAEAALSSTRSKRDVPVPSPWSTLCWTCDDEALAGVLVSIR